MTNGKDTSGRLDARLCSLWVGLAVVMLASCEMPPEQTLPRMSDIRPSKQADQTTETAEGETGVNRPVIALIHRIDLPLSESLEAMWQVVDEGALPLPIRGKWMINGLRIGVLHAEQAQTFSDALPKMQGESRAKLIGSDYPSTIRTTPRLRTAVTVDLTDPPKRPTQFRVIGGRLQLLARVGRDEQGRAFLQLTPHHYKPKTTLLPRSPLEKAMDGRTFDALSVRVSLPRDRAVVVGLYRPWPVNEEPAKSAPAGQDEQTPPTSEQGSVDGESAQRADRSQSKPPAIPDHLGKALMAGRRAGRPTQMLLVISAVDE